MKIFILFLLILTFISGCTPIINSERIIKTNAQIQAFLSSYPNSDIITVDLTEEQAESILSEIRADCGSHMFARNYTKLVVKDLNSGLTMIAWTDPKSGKALCIIRKGIPSNISRALPQQINLTNQTILTNQTSSINMTNQIQAINVTNQTPSVNLSEFLRRLSNQTTTNLTNQTQQSNITNQTVLVNVTNQTQTSNVTCSTGWKCNSPSYIGYQNSNCQWNYVEYCSNGCSNGGCN